MFRKLLNSFNSDVQSVCAAVDAYQRELDALDGQRRIVVPDAFLLAKERAKAVPDECKRLLEQFGRRDVAAYLVYHAAGDLVASGSFHTYRGLLSFTGFELKRLHDVCLARLVESGAFSEETRESAERTLSDDIKRAG